MHVVAVVGPVDERAALADRLVARLGETGRVATVVEPTQTPPPDAAGPDVARHREAGAATGFAVTDDGWSASGDRLEPTGRQGTVEAALERLAPDHDAAVVEGFPEADLPTVAVGEADHGGETLATPADAGAADLDAIAAAALDRDPFESLASLVASVEGSPREERSGAVATFTGRVRAKDAPDDPPTELLEFDRYDEVAAERMADLREELESRDGVYDVELYHRTGVVEAGEHIVHVVVLAGHRGEAFETVQDGINRLKAEVPLFKREVTADEEFWVHERA